MTSVRTPKAVTELAMISRVSVTSTIVVHCVINVSIHRNTSCWGYIADTSISFEVSKDNIY